MSVNSAVISVSSKTKKAIIVFVDKLGLIVFSSAVGVYLADHAKLTELGALEAAGYAGGVAGLTFLLGAAKNWLAKNGG